MKRWKALALTCIAALCCSAVLAGCSSQAYTPTPKNQTISNSALSSAGTLRVGVNASAAPLAGQTSSSSEIVGIDVDVAAAIADELGLKLEVVDVGSDPEGALSSKRADIVLGIDSSTTDSSYWRSSAYLQSGVALFATSSNATVPKVDGNPSIAAQTSSKSSWRVTNLFGDKSLNAQADLKSAFTALSNKNVEYVASDAVIGTYVAHTNGVDAKIIALLQDASGYCAGVSTNNTELQTAVSDALNKIVKGGEMSIIEAKWLGTSLDLSKTTVVKAAVGTKTSALKEDESKTDESSDEGKSTEGADTKTDATE